jgi:pseudouridine synthase
VSIKISQGRNRQIRKMCDEIGHPVINLKRTAIGDIQLRDLKEGEWRYFSID